MQVTAWWGHVFMEAWGNTPSFRGGSSIYIPSLHKLSFVASRHRVSVALTWLRDFFGLL